MITLRETKRKIESDPQAKYLCQELGITPPVWLSEIPAVKAPWFVSGLESLKAIAFVESPLQFRLRKIFVLENFLSRT